MAVSGDRSFILDGIFVTVPKLRILQGVYLAVRPASVCVLFGRNGCGKTTLLKVAAAQIQPDSGIVEIDGERFYSRRQKERFASLAYLPQESMLPDDIRVAKLLGAIPEASAVAEDPVISRLLGQPIRKLSTGERRYLEIRIVLALDREYFLLDEPFTGVEPHLIECMSDLIREAAGRGAGILLTDHYHHFTVPLADDAWLMQNRQSQRLDRGRDVRRELSRLGYLGGPCGPGA